MKPDQKPGQSSLLSFFGKKPAAAPEKHVPASAPGIAPAAKPTPSSEHLKGDVPKGRIDGTRPKAPEACASAAPATQPRPSPAPPAGAAGGGKPAGGAVLGQKRAPAAPAAALSEEQRREKFRRIVGDAEDAGQKGYDEVKERFKWLSKSKVRDGAGRRPGDPLYDPRTVTVPPEKRSSSQQQYWDIKKKYMDVILFFKVGSFYELYEEDAQTGCEVLGWKMTITGVGHCRQVGCPESGIDAAVARLVAAGHRVGRIEQLETGEQAKKAGRSVVRRELLRVVAPSTLQAGEGPSVPADAVHLLALYEAEAAADAGPAGACAPPGAVYGFAFLDAACAKLYLGSIRDDGSRASLGALMAQAAPREVVHGRGQLSRAAARLLARLPAAPVTTALTPGEEMADPRDAVFALRKAAPWGAAWPGAIASAVEAMEAGGPGSEEAGASLSALAALVAHLLRLKVDGELLAAADVLPWEVYAGALRLDGPTVSNLVRAWGLWFQVKGLNPKP